MNNKLTAELRSFDELWNGGYYEGDPLNPFARSTYGPLGFMSVLHATYLLCIKPYIHPETVALEIGPGRGAWTKALLPSKEVYALDALSAEHNGFFEYLGHPKNTKYFQVENFECDFLPDDHFTYMFSFGCLCHVSFEGITKYATNLKPKLQSGAHCFWLVADYAKFNQAVSNVDDAFLAEALFARHRYALLKPLLQLSRQKLELRAPDQNDEPVPGRWYDAGIERTCSMLESLGYQIVDPDVGTCLRDPIIHFMKK